MYLCKDHECIRFKHRWFKFLDYSLERQNIFANIRADLVAFKLFILIHSMMPSSLYHCLYVPLQALFLNRRRSLHQFYSLPSVFRSIPPIIDYNFLYIFFHLVVQFPLPFYHAIVRHSNDES